MIADNPWRPAIALLIALPAAAMLYTGFAAGGYPAGIQAVLAIAMAILLAAWVVLARDPLAGASWPLAVSGGALALLAVWTLTSAAWSHSPARAIIEFDRVLLYSETLILFGLLPMTRQRLRWMLRGVALAAFVLCAAGFFSRTLPDLVTGGYDGRLAYPIGYSNALGLVGALGAVLALHFTTSERERPPVRILAAAAMPLLGATVYLALARGAIVAGAAGLLAYALLGRPRLLLTGVAAAAPAVLIAVRAAASSDALLTRDPVQALAVAQGNTLALTVVACMVGAGAVRGALMLLDRRIAERPTAWISRPAALAIGGAAVLVVLVGFLAAGGPGYAQRNYRAFVERPVVRESSDLSTRLTDPSGSGRADFWRIAIDGFRSEPLHGHGAGTYQLLWHRDRPYLGQLYDGHSLYLESLAELGLLGLALVAVALLALLYGVARRIRGLDRTLFAALFAALLTWALHAGVEWDWELPAVSLWAFAAGGAALATPLRLRDEPGRHQVAVGHHRGRALLGAAVLVLTLLPLALIRSQRPLDRADAAFQDGRCAIVVREANASIRALDLRPEPYELLGFCEVRFGRPADAVRALEAAVRLDPGNWEYHYGLALARGAAGRDPRPALRRALALNPREGLALYAREKFAAAHGPREWRRTALLLRVPYEVIPESLPGR